MFYRRKYYRIKSQFVDPFNELFNTINLPNQRKHGARLIGRWMMPLPDDETEVFAIWEYDSEADYHRIEQAVRADQAHAERINRWFEQHGGRDYLNKTVFIESRHDELISTLADSAESKQSS